MLRNKGLSLLTRTTRLGVANPSSHYVIHQTLDRGSNRIPASAGLLKYPIVASQTPIIPAPQEEMERSKQAHLMYMYNNTGRWFGEGQPPASRPVPTSFIQPNLETVNTRDSAEKDREQRNGPR